MKQIQKRLTYANVMSSLAVFLVLGGATAFAAVQLEKGSVGTSQLKKEAVTLAKIKLATRNALKGQTGPAGPKGEKGSTGDKGAQGVQGVPGLPGSSLAYVEVSGGGSIVNSNAKNITESNISKGTESGTICFKDLDFDWHVVLALRQGSAGTEGVTTYIRGASGGCPAGTEVTVYNRLFSGGAFTSSGNNMMVLFD